MYNCTSLFHIIFKEKDVFYIGRGVDYVTSMEASLKLKEIYFFKKIINIKRKKKKKME